MALRRCVVWRWINHLGVTPDFRMRYNVQNDLEDWVRVSPYRDQYRDFWATPVPFDDREFGPKPKLGDPIPTRKAAAVMLVAHNKHIEPELVESGEDTDYKVLMRFRKTQLRFTKDQFTIPSSPLTLEDYPNVWKPVLERGMVKTEYADMATRLCAWRSLMNDTNVLLIPRNGGSIADVQGPPGPTSWQTIIHRRPKKMKHLADILQMDLEDVLSQLCPFRNIITPATELFRFENHVYVVAIDKMPDMQYTGVMKRESLHWVSPAEAIARFNAGIMEMPTPNVIMMSELLNACPRFEDIQTKLNNHSQSIDILPELVRHTETKVATIILPGDLSHSQTTDEDRARQFFRRFTYIKDYPSGVRAAFEERPTDDQDDRSILVADKPLVIEDETFIDKMYSDVDPLSRVINEAELKQKYLPGVLTNNDPEAADGFVPLRKRKPTADRLREAGSNIDSGFIPRTE